MTSRRQREDVLIVTKVGGEMNGTRGLAPERIAANCEASLRLG